MKQFIILYIVFIFGSTLLIPLSRNIDRCMTVFTFSEDQSVKLEIKFPKIPSRVDG